MNRLITARSLIRRGLLLQIQPIDSSISFLSSSAIITSSPETTPLLARLRYSFLGSSRCFSSIFVSDQKKESEEENKSTHEVLNDSKVRKAVVSSYWGASRPWKCFMPWETYRADLSIDLNKHHVPKTFLDKFAYRTVKLLRIPTDVFFQVPLSNPIFSSRINTHQFSSDAGNNLPGGKKFEEVMPDATGHEDKKELKEGVFLDTNQLAEVVSLEDSLDWRHRVVQPPRVLDQRSLDSCAASALITVTEYMYLIYTGTYYELSLQHAADLPDACNFPHKVCANFSRYCFSVANDGGFFLERDYPYTGEFPDSDSVQARIAMLKNLILDGMGWG